MHLVGARLGTAVANHRAHRDERGLARLRLGCRDRRFQCLQIVAIGHALRVPVVCLKALQHIVVVAQFRRPVERDQVVVVEHYQLAQGQGASQRACLVRNAFHQIAIAAQHIGVVIHNLVAGLVVDRAEVPLGHRHADAHRKALAQRTRRYLYPIGVTEFGMPRRPRMPLAKALQIVNRHLVPGKKQRGVKQGRSVPIRQDEAIAVRPLRSRRVVLHRFVKKKIGYRCTAQRRARMTALGLLHLVNSQQPQCVNRKFVE